MTTVSDTNRYNLPVMEFISTLLQEEFPELNLAEGSVLHYTLIRPAALMLQPFRDFQRLLARNTALKNFQVMDEAELDAVASNFLITRRDGVRARGTQRVFFQTLQPVSIGPDARFSDDAGRVFLPVASVAMTTSQLEAQVLASTGEYYVDVPVVARIAGEDGMVSAGTVRNFQGIIGATRTTNAQSFTAGKNRDSNTELYNRILGSVTNRDLVKSTAISQALLNEFESIRQVEVVGFGDQDMTRDTARVVLAVQSLFPRSFCTKVNVPLDSDGNIKFVEDDGVTVITTPIGGYVGGIVDNMDLDFRELVITLDGVVFETIAVQPGFRVRLYGADANDPDVGEYVVTRIVDGPIAPNGQNERVLLLDRPLDRESLDEDDLDTYPYTIVGAVSSNLFHVGGKVDVYVDSTGSVEKEVIITTVVTDDAGRAEIPLASVASLPSGASLFEDSIGFESPVLAISKIEELDPTSNEIVIRTLIADTHYVVVRAESRGRFTYAPEDVLIIRGRDETVDPPVPLFEGSRLKVTYVTNPDFAAIQDYVDDSANRDVTKDIMVKAPQIVLVDVDFEYRGTVSQEDVQAIVTEFISEKSFEPELTVNEIVTVLSFFGVRDISMPVTLTSSYDKGDGNVEVDSSSDRLSAGRVQVFRAVPGLSIRKIG